MPDISARLSLPFIQPSQAQKHVTHNEALLRLDLLAQLVVEEFDASTPPGSPVDGQVWALASTPTAAWAGHGDELAAWFDGAWMFIAPQEGWRALGKVDVDLRIWDGGSWDFPAQPDLNNLNGIGINASFDPNNRLSVSSPATLLNHEGAGHQLKINKASTSDTASLLFQTAWSGRAEMGCAGTDDFSIKVSPDGSNWTPALTIDSTTGGMQVHSGQTYFEDVLILNDSVWSFDIPWSDPARILLWIGIDITGWSLLLSVTGPLAGASNFTEMFTSPPGGLNFFTGPLTGTTGTSGGVNLSIDTSGSAPRMYIENRIGTDRTFTLATVGK